MEGYDVLVHTHHIYPTSNNDHIILGGQSAAYYEIGVEDLLPGVDMALSAMTAHALLQQDGFTLNPF